jgi:hypothetical protein
MQKIPALALLCLIIGGYAVCQSNPPNPPGGQQTTTASADQPAKPADDAKPATDASKPAANDAATKATPANTPASAHTPVAAVKIPSGSRIYIAPMNGGYENYVTAAILKKKIPVQIVMDRDKADYEIRGSTDSERAGWAKMLFLKSDFSNEQASVVVTEIKSNTVVYAYSVNFHSSSKGKQSTAESIGKHLKEAIAKD